MPRLTSDTLKLGAAIVVLGATCFLGWVGLAVVLSGRPDFWADLSVIALGNLILTAIVGLLAWVLSDQTASGRRLDA